MSAATERAMQAIFDALLVTEGATTVRRRPVEKYDYSQLPLIILNQGQERYETTTHGANPRVECELDLSISIVVGGGSQNFETALNNMARNVIVQLNDIEGYRIEQTEMFEPEVDDASGQFVGTTRMLFTVYYTRLKNDPL